MFASRSRDDMTAAAAHQDHAPSRPYDPGNLDYPLDSESRRNSYIEAAQASTSSRPLLFSQSSSSPTEDDDRASGSNEVSSLHYRLKSSIESYPYSPTLQVTVQRSARQANRAVRRAIR